MERAKPVPKTIDSYGTEWTCHAGERSVMRWAVRSLVCRLWRGKHDFPELDGSFSSGFFGRRRPLRAVGGRKIRLEKLPVQLREILFSSPRTRRTKWEAVGCRACQDVDWNGFARSLQQFETQPVNVLHVTAAKIIDHFDHCRFIFCLPVGV